MKYLLITTLFLGIGVANMTDIVPVEHLKCEKTYGSHKGCSLSCDFIGVSVKCGPAGAGMKYFKCAALNGPSFLVSGNPCE